MNYVDALAAYGIQLKLQGGRPSVDEAEVARVPEHYQSTVKNILDDMDANKMLAAEQIQRAESLRELAEDSKAKVIEMLENKEPPDRIIVKLSNIIMHQKNDKAFYINVRKLMHENYSYR